MSGIDRKELGLAIAAIQKLHSDFQERETTRAVFQDAERVLKALAAADSALPAMVKRRDQIQGEIDSLTSQAQEAKRNLDPLLADARAQREKIQAETSEFLANEKRKRKAAEERTSDVTTEFDTAERAHAARMVQIRTETQEAENALSAIKAQIEKFKHLAG